MEYKNKSILSSFQPVIFSGCDTKYFIEHGLAFAKSAVQHNHKVAIVVSPNHMSSYNEQVVQMNQFLNDQFYPSFDGKDKIKVIQPNFLKYFHDIKTEDDRTYFTVFRFLELQKIMEIVRTVPFLMVDIDSIFQKEVHVNLEFSVGMYMREDNTIGSNQYEIDGMKVNASAFAVTPKGLPFLNKVNDKIRSREMRWFADQYILYETYLDELQNDRSFVDLSKLSLITWDMEDGYAIFTGKGSRKYNDKKYLTLKKEIENAASVQTN